MNRSTGSTRDQSTRISQNTSGRSMRALKKAYQQDPFDRGYPVPSSKYNIKRNKRDMNRLIKAKSAKALHLITSINEQVPDPASPPSTNNHLGKDRSTLPPSGKNISGRKTSNSRNKVMNKSATVQYDKDKIDHTEEGKIGFILVGDTDLYIYIYIYNYIGPGTYSQPRMCELKARKLFKNNPAYTFGHKYLHTTIDVPGAADYSPDYDKLWRHRPNAHLASATRFEIYKREAAKSPGPIYRFTKPNDVASPQSLDRGVNILV